MFVTPHWRVEQLDRLGKIGSDHFPILYRVCLTEPAGRRMTAVAPPPAVRAEARDETAEGKREERAEGDDRSGSARSAACLPRAGREPYPGAGSDHGRGVLSQATQPGPGGGFPGGHAGAG